jgi:hypothetical protein
VTYPESSNRVERQRSVAAFGHQLADRTELIAGAAHQQHLTGVQLEVGRRIGLELTAEFRRDNRGSGPLAQRLW